MGEHAARDQNRTSYRYVNQYRAWVRDGVTRMVSKLLDRGESEKVSLLTFESLKFDL